MKAVIVLIICTLLTTCSAKKALLYSQGYVGDITYDPNIDAKNFKLCDAKRAYQYFNDSRGLEYIGEKAELIKIFSRRFKKTSNESGWVRIRFIVNCNGKAGMFRIDSADNNYEKVHFSDSVTAQLLQITKKLTGWKAKEINGQKIDYYQYLIFKLNDGHIDCILP